MQLICGLIKLLHEKFKKDLEEIVFDDKLFTHNLDEVLLFTKELQSLEPHFHEVQNHYNLLKLFTVDPYFSRVLNLERKSECQFFIYRSSAHLSINASFIDFLTEAAEIVEATLESKTAWNVVIGSDSNDDQLKIPESVDNFVLMLQAVTGKCGTKLS